MPCLDLSLMNRLGMSNPISEKRNNAKLVRSGKYNQIADIRNQQFAVRGKHPNLVSLYYLI